MKRLDSLRGDQYFWPPKRIEQPKHNWIVENGTSSIGKEAGSSDGASDAGSRMRISRIRTFIKRVEKAIESGDHHSAQQALRDAQPEIMRGVSKGVLKLGTASRKVSRLSARVKALGSAQA